MRSLESTDKDAEALVGKLDERLKNEKKSYDMLRQKLEEVKIAREMQLALNNSIALKNQILEQKRQELARQREDLDRRKVRHIGLIRLILIF